MTGSKGVLFASHDMHSKSDLTGHAAVCLMVQRPKY
jgi:hypothetical protein